MNIICYLLPLLQIKPKRLGVLRNRSFGLVLNAVGEGCLNLKAHLDHGVGIVGEQGDDFLGYLDQLHLRHGWLDTDVAVERLRLCGCGCCRWC